jgi:hypothetical protein
MTSKRIIEIILNDISNLNIGRFDYYYIPHRSDFTRAITKSIVDTCSKLDLEIILEYNVEVSEDILKDYKRLKNGYTDVVIRNDLDKDIAIEIDSSFKKWSYKKLEILNKKGMYSTWFVWKRKVPGKELKWKDPIELGFTNEKIHLMTHTFYADEEKLHTTPK